MFTMVLETRGTASSAAVLRAAVLHLECPTDGIDEGGMDIALLETLTSMQTMTARGVDVQIILVSMGRLEERTASMLAKHPKQLRRLSLLLGVVKAKGDASMAIKASMVIRLAAALADGRRHVPAVLDVVRGQLQSIMDALERDVRYMPRTPTQTSIAVTDTILSSEECKCYSLTVMPVDQKWAEVSRLLPEALALRDEVARMEIETQCPATPLGTALESRLLAAMDSHSKGLHLRHDETQAIVKARPDPRCPLPCPQPVQPLTCAVVFAEWYSTHARFLAPRPRCGQQ